MDTRRKSQTLTLLVLAALLVACGSPASTPTSAPTPDGIPPTGTPALPTPTAAPPVDTPLPPIDISLDLAAFEIDLAAFSGTGVTAWEPQPYAGPDYALPLDLGQIANLPVTSNLTEAQIDFLARNGFVVIHSQESQYLDIRQSMSRQTQPYFLTTDAGFHSLHLDFDELLKALELEYLRPEMVAITQAVYAELLAYQASLQDTPLESDAQLAVAYMAVALKLFDPDAVIDPQVAGQVEAQIEQIMAGAGRDFSVLISGFEDDYGAYKPVGHYAGDAELEQYFRGMTWLGRVHFKLSPDSGPPSRVPLLVTTALRNARIDDLPAADSWGQIHEILTFMIGPSDDGGPVEYAALMDEVYGSTPALLDLADDGLWQQFLSRSGELPTPQINSTFVDWVTTGLAGEVGWRFMGQRFTLDAFIFQNLIFDHVGTLDNPRNFPSGLDVMAVMGSQPALESLEVMGETAYANYPEQFAMLREAVQAQPDDEWQGRFYDAWLYTFFPLLEAKDGSYPAYMQRAAWGYKDLNTALGSWAELKHDTVLYVKMPEGAGGGGPPYVQPIPPGYLEANPAAFYRMAFIARTIVTGLRERGVEGSEMLGVFSSPGLASLNGLSEQSIQGSGIQGAFPDLSLAALLAGMEGLAGRFEALGDLAARELAGVPLTEADYQIIQACLGLVECTQVGGPYSIPRSTEPPPIISAVSGSGDLVLEAGTGYVDRIYVVVPMGDALEIAQGGVYSYYEFTQPRSNRLTDDEWREKLDSGTAPDLPEWAANFVLTGGRPTPWLAFRIGTTYKVAEAGEDLNLRADPSLGGEVIGQLPVDSLLTLIGGPVIADGETWWQVDLIWPDQQTGWVVERQDWYEKAP